METYRYRYHTEGVVAEIRGEKAHGHPGGHPGDHDRFRWEVHVHHVHHCRSVHLQDCLVGWGIQVILQGREHAQYQSVGAKVVA